MRIIERLKTYLLPEPPPAEIVCEFFGGPLDGTRRMFWPVVIEGGVWSHKLPSGNLALYSFGEIEEGFADAEFDTYLMPTREPT